MRCPPDDVRVLTFFQAPPSTRTRNVPRAGPTEAAMPAALPVKLVLSEALPRVASRMEPLKAFLTFFVFHVPLVVHWPEAESRMETRLLTAALVPVLPMLSVALTRNLLA